MSEAAKPNGATPVPAPAPAAPAPMTGEERLIESFNREAAGDFDVEAFMRADFTKPETAMPKPEEMPNPSAAVAPPSPAPAPPEPPPAAAPTVVEQTLIDQGQTLRELAQQFQQGKQPAVPQVDPRLALAQEYTVPISPELIEAIRGDDPAQASAAIQALITVPAVLVHQRMVKELETFQSRIGDLVTAKIQELGNVQTMRSDFYGRHAHFNNEFGRKLVVAAAGEVARKNPGKYKGYTPELGNAIAEEIYAVMPQLRPAPAPTEDTRQNPTPPAPPAFFPSGARPAQGQEGEVESFLRQVSGLF